MARSRVLASSSVVVYVNGKLFGHCASFSFSSHTPRKAIYGLDSTEPYELAPTTTRVSASMQVYRLVGDAGAEGAGITAPYDDLPKEKYFTVMLVDRGSDSTLFRADYCSLTSQSWSIPSRGIVTGSLDIEAINWSNELNNR